MSVPNHNLNIQSYSLDEILGLFDLESYDITIEDLKTAKRKVLMLHPDKSRLDAKYFLFYKKAFDVIVQFFDNQNRQNRSVEQKDVAYNPNYKDEDKSTTKQIQKTMQDMKSQNFQEKFNELFEANQMGSKPDQSRNEWFVQEKSAFDIPQEKMSKQAMNDNFQRIKDQSNGLIHYTGVQSMNDDSATNNNFYEDQDDYSNKYMTSDPFSKLKFDDLRKVHRDQSVLAVSERDINNIQTYRSVEEFNRARSQHSYDPLEKEHANRLLQEQEKAMQQRMMQKEYRAKLQTEQYAEKNKNVLSSFLLLQNKK
jgi:hypothetical protein